MVLLLQKAWRVYVYLFEELADPRTAPWLLVAKPYQIICVEALYLAVVLIVGPKWMQNRKQFNIDKLLIVYNIFQIIVNSYMFIEGLRLGWLREYKWTCEPIDYSNSPRAIEIASIVHFFFMIKLTDLLDTIFMVLRKKKNKVSFLHIYHHLGMVLLAWGVTTYLPGGHGTLTGLINSFVHVVMYGYYLLTVATPTIKKIIWIKKFVTQLQIAQFFMGIVHFGIIVFTPDCAYPRWTAAVMLPQNLFLFALFADFYIKTYKIKPKNRIK